MVSPARRFALSVTDEALDVVLGRDHDLEQRAWARLLRASSAKSNVADDADGFEPSFEDASQGMGTCRCHGAALAFDSTRVFCDRVQTEPVTCMAWALLCDPLERGGRCTWGPYGPSRSADRSWEKMGLKAKRIAIGESGTCARKQLTGGSTANSLRQALLCGLHL
jgi:hypothetical protein